MIHITWSIKESFSADVDESALRECFDPDDHRLGGDGQLDLDRLLGDSGYSDLDSLLADLEMSSRSNGVQERHVDRIQRRADTSGHGSPVATPAPGDTPGLPAPAGGGVLRALLAALNARAYLADGPDTGTPYYVVDLHGVSIGVKRRARDLYVHLDTTETPDRTIAIEINGGGEHDHPVR